MKRKHNRGENKFGFNSLYEPNPNYSMKTKVENIGFEPMTSCMPCKRSSQLS